MVTRNLYCGCCGYRTERTALQMNEPSRVCPECLKHGALEEMNVVPSFPAGVRYVPGCGGFHCCDYPPSNEELKKQYGFDKHDSTNDMSDYVNE